MFNVLYRSAIVPFIMQWTCTHTTIECKTEGRSYNYYPVSHFIVTHLTYLHSE